MAPRRSELRGLDLSMTLAQSGVLMGRGPFGDGRQGSFGAAGAEEAERPADQGAEAVLEAGEEGRVDEEPHHPPEEPGDPDAVEAHDRAATRDRGHAAEVAV